MRYLFLIGFVCIQLFAIAQESAPAYVCVKYEDTETNFMLLDGISMNTRYDLAKRFTDQMRVAYKNEVEVSYCELEEVPKVAVLVVGVQTGAVPPILDHVKQAEELGVKFVIVFLDEMDVDGDATDPELPDLAFQEARSMFDKIPEHQFAEVRGSLNPEAEFEKYVIKPFDELYDMLEW